MRALLYVADQHPDKSRSRGITGYTDGLVTALSRERGVRVTCLTSRSSWRPSDASVGEITLPFRTDHLLGRLAADHGHAIRIPLEEIDVCHYPKGFLPIVRRGTLPTVGTVHDLIVAHYAGHYPESRSRLAFVYWMSVLRRSLRNLDMILTVSVTSRDSIEAFCDREGLACPPIVVCYEGARWEEDASREAVKGSYVLHFGSPLPHKRTGTLLEFWSVLAEHGHDLPTLHIVGPLSENQRRRMRLMRGVSHTDWLPDHELKTRIQSALAVIIPSEIEGFGLPALEAYYLGTPVVFVRRTAVEEILGGGSPGGFELESVESFERALGEALDLSATAVRSVADGLRARFSWERCARRTLAAYEHLG
jgi:glycosyltransferase involved in cell wall biosynthesis